MSKTIIAEHRMHAFPRYFPPHVVWMERNAARFDENRRAGHRHATHSQEVENTRGSEFDAQPRDPHRDRRHVRPGRISQRGRSRADRHPDRQTSVDPSALLGQSPHHSVAPRANSRHARAGRWLRAGAAAGRDQPARYRRLFRTVGEHAPLSSRQSQSLCHPKPLPAAPPVPEDVGGAGRFSGRYHAGGLCLAQSARAPGAPI